MGRIDWDDSMSIDNTTVDNQHKKLIELYNTLHESILNDSDQEAKETKMTTLYGLREYTSYHFKTEEEYMKAISYPELNQQQQSHQKFREKIDKLVEDLENGRTVLSTSIIKLIRNWIVDHISTEDAKIREFNKRSTKDSEL